ncbi:MAG: ribonuclease H family protein [Bacteroidales bacterium]|jgi:ribonuclease HI|nr:ribonuclease H family protein [Bacteroidales bacterium]MDD3160296.1 ribonuclease H family protein [Bacteroidales bacterium]
MKKKYYVVWSGNCPGIYETWDECKRQTFGFPNAHYRAFPSKEEAEEAFQKGYSYPKKIEREQQLVNQTLISPIKESIAVDAACSGNPGKMEYRGVYVADGCELFHIGPFEEGTNNIGEFLALVHALAFLKKANSRLPVYSDSRNAIAWVKHKKCNTKLIQSSRNRKVFDLIERAEKWLAENSYQTRIMKWETPVWGEIPADFGRK